MEREEVERLVRDICISFFRGEAVEYGRGCRSEKETGDESIGHQIAYFFLISLMILFCLPFPLNLALSMLFWFVTTRFFLISRSNPPASTFNTAEELIVTEFMASMPELSFSETQIIKSLRLAYFQEDKDLLLRSLCECRYYPNLSRWSFIEWLTAKTPVS
ncbi:MAG: hypothetical protein ABIH38_00775 [Patescibacteria group bacterium]